MRFSLCILPFIGRRKSSRHCRSLRPGVQHVSASASGSTVLDEKREEGDGRIEVLPKSILKKPHGRGLVEVGKGRVKWMDCSGKELFEIREFEPVSPPSPHLVELESKCKYRHLRRFSLFPQKITLKSPYPVAVLGPPVDPRIGSLINLQRLYMSSCNTHPFNEFSEHPPSCAATPTFLQVDPLEGTLVSSQQSTTVGTPRMVSFIEPQHQSLVAETPSLDPLSFPSSGGIQHQWYRRLRRNSSAPSSNRSYFQRYHAIFRSKSSGYTIQQTIER